jgi:hypothetical protein
VVITGRWPASGLVSVSRGRTLRCFLAGGGLAVLLAGVAAWRCRRVPVGQPFQPLSQFLPLDAPKPGWPGIIAGAVSGQVRPSHEEIVAFFAPRVCPGAPARGEAASYRSLSSAAIWTVS